MDNVYNIASYIEASNFNHMIADKKQIMLYTDGPAVAMLYFTLDTGVPKVLTLRFCMEAPEIPQPCIDETKVKVDANGNGWWDSVEALFYKK